MTSNEFLAAKQKQLAGIDSTIDELNEISQSNGAFLQQREYRFLREDLDKRVTILEDWKILWNQTN